MIDLNNIDIILYVDKSLITEDERIQGGRSTDPIYHGDRINIVDPKLYSAFAYGKVLQQGLSTDPTVTCEVADFGKYVSVTVGCSNAASGRTNKKTFLIVFEDKGDGMIMSASNKWRSISGVQQAISYIKSIISVLKNDVTKRL